MVDQLDRNSFDARTPRLKNQQQLNIQCVAPLIGIKGGLLQYLPAETFEAALGVEDSQRQNSIHDVRESLPHVDTMAWIGGIHLRIRQIACSDHGVAAAFNQHREGAVESSCGIGEIRVYQKNQISRGSLNPRLQGRPFSAVLFELEKPGSDLIPHDLGGPVLASVVDYDQFQ